MEEKEELLEQLEFCTEADCFWNTNCVCYCKQNNKDPRYGKGCPQYQSDLEVILCQERKGRTHSDPGPWFGPCMRRTGLT